MALPADPAQAAERGTDVIDLRVPADPAYLAVIRTATDGVAMRLDLTLDQIEDLRIAVDEACALLLDGAAAGRAGTVESWLHALFQVDAGTDGRLDIRITGPRGRAPLDTGYPWMLLQALVSEVASGSDATGRWISLSRHLPPA